MRRAGILLIAVLTVALSGCVFITRASVSTSSGESNGNVGGLSMSGDGRYVAFESDGSNLVPGDANGTYDVFVRDLMAHTTTRASVDTDGGDPDNLSGGASISGDGRYVGFGSAASDLVPGDNNGAGDAFVRDLVEETTIRASVDSAGGDPAGGSGAPSISGNGRYAAFVSSASDLVPGDTNGLTTDVFVRDLVAGTTALASIDTAGGYPDAGSFGVSISSSGRYVAFHSEATDLVSDDGNGFVDVFVRDLVAGTTTRASVDATGGDSDGADPQGLAARPSISADGRYVAFESDATDLVSGDANGVFDIFVRDLVAGTTTRASVDASGGDSNNFSFHPSISADGRYLAFDSNASDLVGGDINGATDVFVRDRTNGVTQRVSLRLFYGEANGPSFTPSISGDGRYVALKSFATNLIRNDTNDLPDVFVKFALAPRPLATVGPTSIARGTTGQITITGSWFDPDILQVSVNPGAGVSIDNISVGSPNTSAVLTITVAADAETGSRDLLVTNPGNPWNFNAGGSDICTGCLTVT